MDDGKLIAALERFGSLLPAVVRDLSPGDAAWKPPDDAWSILEVVSHLADEEVEDFRTRLRLTLEDPGKDWPPIDPPRWAIERRYNRGRMEDAVARFVRERAASIHWLKSLKDPDWSKAVTWRIIPQQV